MSLETIKKLIWSSNMFFFGSKKIDKNSFYWFYGFISACFLMLVLLIGVWVI